MDSVTRRTLLKQAVVAGSGATVFGAFASEAGGRPAATAKAPDPSVIDPNFIAGKVVDSGAGVLVVRDPDRQYRRVRVAPDGEVWREGFVGGGLKVDDCIYGRGLVGDDGVLTLRSAWVSIFNLGGRLARKQHDGFAVEPDRSDLAPFSFHLLPYTVMADGSPAAAGLDALPLGTPMRVIGFESGSTGELAATRIIGSPPDAAAAPDPAPVITSTGVIIYGVATWQCCGGVNGCGSGNFSGCNPPPSSHGACGTCRTDQQGLAWPNLTTGCRATCFSCCVTMDTLACGQYVTICNMCPPNYCPAIPVNDCGPNLHCVVANRCQGYKVVKWDLTACSFTAAGGNLSVGLMDSQATYFI
jgi:hypothetical protein